MDHSNSNIHLLKLEKNKTIIFYIAVFVTMAGNLLDILNLYELTNPVFYFNIFV
jgi:hypothetical protein